MATPTGLNKKGAPVFEARQGAIATSDLLHAAGFLCRGWLWTDRHRWAEDKDDLTVEFKPRPLQFIERLLNNKTGEVTVVFVIGGDPLELLKRSRLLANGEIYHKPDEYRKHHMHLTHEIEKARKEGRERWLATKGGVQVESN